MIGQPVRLARKCGFDINWFGDLNEIYSSHVSFTSTVDDEWSVPAFAKNAKGMPTV